MTTQTYTYLLANPQNIKKDHLSELDTVIDNYPFFQSARALRLKGLKNDSSFLYNEALKKTAAHTTDRDILFEYITSDEFIQNQISEIILKHDSSVNDINVIAENLSETVSLELDKQIKSELQKAEAILNPALFERKHEAVVKIVKSDSSKKVQEMGVVQPDKPIPFTKDDTHSFGEWLKLTNAQPIDRSNDSMKETIKDQDEKERKFELIERFIQQKPKIKPHLSETANQNLAEPYTRTSDSLMTETLAKVYLQQKNYEKAIQAYRILILKNPEKSGFFADQIRAIEKLKKKES